MKLRYIILGNHRTDCESENLMRRYSQEVWCIDYYLTRLTRKERIESGKFNSIVVTPVETRAIKAPWIGMDNLNVDVPFDWSAYAASHDPIEVNTMFYNLVKEGFERLRNGWGLPIDRLQEILESFREGGFVNEWNFKRRQFREYGLKASLDCKIDLKNFSLTLTVTKGKDILFHDVILTTDTDSIFWYDCFKDIVVQNGRIEIPRRMQSLADDGTLSGWTLFSWDIPND